MDILFPIAGNHRKVWRGAGGRKASGATGILRGNDSVEPRSEAHHEENGHLFLHEYY